MLQAWHTPLVVAARYVAAACAQTELEFVVRLHVDHACAQPLQLQSDIREASFIASSALHNRQNGSNMRALVCFQGLDPASRRNLWDVVKKNKSGRAIVLTTHSMEEAETLCDRLGIFVDGRLVCIGNPKEITSRYSGFLVRTRYWQPFKCDAHKEIP